MKVKLNDTLVAKDSGTTIREGQVIAIGDDSVVVRITKARPNGPSVGDLYEIIYSWFDSLYLVQGDFFKIGKTYQYKDAARSIANPLRYKVIELIHLDNPLHQSDADVAVVIATNDDGRQWVDLVNRNDFERMELV